MTATIPMPSKSVKKGEHHESQALANGSTVVEADKPTKKRKRLAEERLAGPVSGEAEEATRKAKKAARLMAGERAETEAEDTDKVRAKREKKERKRAERLLREAAAAAATTASSSEPAEVERPKKKRKPAADVTSGSTSATLVSPAPEPSSDAASYLSTNGISLHPPSTLLTPLLTFPSLPIRPSLLSSPALAGFNTPTPIQACCWPLLFRGEDVVGVAETGSGKTLGFGLPAVEHILNLERKEGVEVLVLAPTRELAIQTHQTLDALGRPLGVGSVCLFGGVGKDEQRAALAGTGGKGKKGKGGKGGARIVVGTPGRVLDLIEEGVCDVSGVTYLVLDEADRMLDRGFEPAIRRILALTPSERQTAMFSATWPESVRRLAEGFMRDPVRVTVGSDELEANKKVEQVVEVLDNSWSKDDRLKALLKQVKASDSGNRTLVFVLYKKEASRVHSNLQRLGYKAGAIHGDMGQTARLEALEEFKAGRKGVLVATDVAARGLDIPSVGTVINYSFPLTIEDYVHRIGRTGRAGASGKSITLFTGEAHEKALAGELMRVVRDAGGVVPPEMSRFPATIRKKEHAVYGAFYKDVSGEEKGKKIVFS